MRHSKPVRLKTAPTGDESVYLFLEFIIKKIGAGNQSESCGMVSMRADFLTKA